MKGSDSVKMTLNIGGEFIELDVDFDDQINVRNTERALKNHIDHLRKQWPDKSDRNILAMAAYQFANWFRRLKNELDEAQELAQAESARIINCLEDSLSQDEDSE